MTALPTKPTDRAVDPTEPEPAPPTEPEPAPLAEPAGPAGPAGPQVGGSGFRPIAARRARGGPLGCSLDVHVDSL